MLAKIERYGKGRCALTGVQTDDGVEMRLGDGSVKGFVTWEQFQKLLKSRSENGDGQMELPMPPQNPMTPP